eukprot:TRINITY_DN44348_c0_g1_i1.p1 TRINITY_DN44348_c0_g1~~TRINITY_DN44348_c0_g1_i1.p1  ORF type:complete len:121 (-),score=23.19 TRINITY_DN44348_c0_g1_i1:44-406(-)
MASARVASACFRGKFLAPGLRLEVQTAQASQDVGKRLLVDHGGRATAALRSTMPLRIRGVSNCLLRDHGSSPAITADKGSFKKDAAILFGIAAGCLAMSGRSRLGKTAQWSRKSELQQYK